MMERLEISNVKLDENLQIIEWSPQAGRYALAGLVPGEPIWNAFPELACIEAEVEEIRAGRLEHLRLDKINRLTDDNSADRYHSVTILPYQQPDNPTRLVVFFQDVTEAGLLEREITQQRNELSILRYRLEEQNERLTELNNIKSAFLGIAAHELRSPLNSVRGFLELVTDGSVGELNAEQAQYLGIVSKGVNRMITLTNDLLDIERIESGKMELDIANFSLPILAQTVVNNFQVEINQKHMEVDFENADKDMRVNADMSRVEQVLTNFVSNALKYSPERTRVAIRFERRDNLLLTHIADQGIGINAADQEKLFQRFFRASNANSKGARGNGLGLSIVRAIIERHGGKVWVESKLGEGSVFSFSLPAA
jgi:signal transduction histidine kinase